MGDFAVQKYGGTSASQPERVAEVFSSNPERNKVAVVSAIGKDYGEQNGQPKVTDETIKLEHLTDTGDWSAATEVRDYVLERYKSRYSALGERALKKHCDYAYGLLKPETRSQGYRWVGEHLSARMFADLTGAIYVPSALRFSGNALQLQRSIEAIREAVMPYVHQGKQIVTEGYFGFDVMSGNVTVLPRGGSDITGVIYPGALNGINESSWVADNYTDKDGILSADPDIVGADHTVLINEMTYKEVREKMHGIKERNGVIHGNSITYAARLGVEIFVRNTFNPESAGTHITSSRHSDTDHPIIGISGKGNIPAVSVYDMGMADAVGYLHTILGKIGEHGMSVSHLPTGEESVGFIFNTETKDDGLESIQRYIADNAISNGAVEVETDRDTGIVYLVGQDLCQPRAYTRILGRVASIMDEADFPILEVVSHRLSPSLAVTVNGHEVEDVIRLLHDRLIEQ